MAIEATGNRRSAVAAPSYFTNDELSDPFTTGASNFPPTPAEAGLRDDFTFERQGPTKYFHSRLLKDRKVDMPWLRDRSQIDLVGNWLPKLGFVVGVIGAAIIIWIQVRYIENPNFCLIVDDDFSHGFNESVWTKEVECGGYGNGEFEVTTNTDENVFVYEGNLWIKPTLQDPELIYNNYTMNLLETGQCTGSSWQECVGVTNLNNGSIISPVKSGRINSKKAGAIKYGRIEVDARLPSGDWLWPAIWMLPVDNAYGVWPRSGEIDIMESRGNDPSYPMGGRNKISSALHWGPDSENDGYWRNMNNRYALHSTFAEEFHTFGLEWNEKYIFTYIDTRLLQVIYMRFNEPFWTRGDFDDATDGGNNAVNPWGQTGRDQTPFDQDFYLILNIAVGGTNGWFEDAVANKPWVDGSTYAASDFWEAQDTWYPTWEQGGQMVVKSVKIYQQEGYNGCVHGRRYWPPRRAT